MNAPTEDEPAIEIGPAADARASVIWLHGLGADGHDFESLVPQLGLVESLGVRFVLPHAPYRPVTLNRGHVMRAWYDLRNPDLPRHEDEPGIRAAADGLRDRIAREQALGIPSERIVLAGFSQGGALALHTGLRYAQPLAGIVALSTYLPLAEQAEAETAAANRQIEVFLAHGARDPVIPLPTAQKTRERLSALGCKVQWHGYPMMPHSLCAQEVDDIRNWLRQKLA